MKKYSYKTTEANENMARRLEILHAMFRRTHRIAMIIIGFVIMAAEIAITLLFYMDALFRPDSDYLQKRLIFPQVLVWLCVWMAFGVEKTSLKNAQKNFALSFLFSIQVSVIAFFHNIFPALWCLPASIIIFCSIYSDESLCFKLMLYSFCVTGFAAYQNYHDILGLGKQIPPNVICTLMIDLSGFFIGKTMISFMRYQEKMQISLIEEKMELSEKNRLDPLTKLYNKENIFKFMNDAINKTKNMDIQIGVAVIDIDDFKEVNDHYGHDKGDLVLVALSNIIHLYSDSKITGGRFGGEEFIIFFYDVESNERLKILERMRAEFENTKYSFLDRKVTFSGGIKGSVYPHPTAEELFIEADKALYQAKRMGKNRIVESFEV